MYIIKALITIWVMWHDTRLIVGVFFLQDHEGWLASLAVFALKYVCDDKSVVTMVYGPSKWILCRGAVKCKERNYVKQTALLRSLLSEQNEVVTQSYKKNNNKQIVHSEQGSLHNQTMRWGSLNYDTWQCTTQTCSLCRWYETSAILIRAYVYTNQRWQGLN